MSIGRRCALAAVCWLALPWLAGCRGEKAVITSASESASAERAAVEAAGGEESPTAGAASTGSTDNATPAANTARGLIGFSALTLTNPFFKIIADNLRESAAAAGFTVAVDDADRDVKKQAEQIDSYITRGAAAIVINPCDRLSIGPAIQRANQAGIPVFTTDLECVAEGVTIAGHVGTDNYQGGQLAGRAMIEALGEAGGKVLIVHFRQANSCVLRVDGFRQAVDEYNSDRTSGRLTIVGEVEGGGLRDEAFSAVASAIQKETDLAGIFAINDPSALGARAALEQAGKADQIKIVAFDGQLDGKRAIRDGKIYADPIQFPEQMGRQVVEKIQRYLNGQPFEPVTLIPTELYRRADALQDPALN